MPDATDRPAVAASVAMLALIPAVAVGEGAVWMTLDSGPALRRADPTGRRPVEVIDLPFLPRSVAVGAGSVWITGLIHDGACTPES